MSVRDVWQKVLERLYPTMNAKHFITWFQSTALLSIENGIATIGVPSEYAHRWLQEKYDVKLLQAIKELDVDVKELKYEVHQSLESGKDARVVQVEAIVGTDFKKTRKVKGDMISLGSGLVSKFLNERYTLDNFVVGKDNRLPHAACQAVATSPFSIYNPLFIYGRVGLGKTHLLQATGNAILRNFPEKKVCYITSEQFVNDVVEAIGQRHTKGFKSKYRGVDVLIVDDVQFFCNKSSSREEFFHTFNELYDRNKQIIMSSDRPPSELDGLEDRLTSRFGMGMVVEVQPPDYETRLAILQEKAQSMNMLIDREVLEFIAENVKSSVRALEGALTQAVAAADLEHAVPTVRFVASVLRRVQPGFALANVVEHVTEVRGVDDVISIVSEYYKLSRTDLVGSVRKKEIMVPRQVCMYLIRKELNESYERIGSDFGGRNHSTVLHACNKVISKLKFDKRLVRDVNAIKQQMGL